MVITEKMVERALEIAKPAIEAILDAPEATWGPKWVETKVMAPGLETPVKFTFGCKTEWKPEWGKELDFGEIMEYKFTTARREKQNSSIIALTKPWLLYEGEYLYAGAAYRDGITTAASGARGWADEAISELVISIVIMLAHIEVDERVFRHEMRI
jgi:hypothetical protein